MSELIQIQSISEMHSLLQLEPPTHPLISMYHHSDFDVANLTDLKFCSDLYMIWLKDGCICEVGYGRSSYDYEEGSMMFVAPGQVISAGVASFSKRPVGWTLVFHPNLIRRSALGQTIHQYSYFSYESNEALHLSDKEIQMVTDIAEKIEFESSQNIDRHSQRLIISNLQLLLDYCTRFYDRQFYTRSNLNQDYVINFEKLLHDYYRNNLQIENGIPTVQYCGQELGMSPHYLSDLLKQETGKNALEHIHLFLVEKAKTLILGTKQSMTEIAFDLGFEYSQHFSKLFKAKTGMTPREYRKV